MADEQQFRIHMTCCGRDAGVSHAMSWAEVDALREAYLSGPGVRGPGEPGYYGGHERTAIVIEAWWHEHAAKCDTCKRNSVSTCPAGKALRAACGFVN